MDITTHPIEFLWPTVLFLICALVLGVTYEHLWPWFCQWRREKRNAAIIRRRLLEIARDRRRRGMA